MPYPVDLLKNDRAEQIWSQVIESVDFKDKHVVDLGCGYGDFLAKAHHAGAKTVLGIDKDVDVLEIAAAKIQNLPRVKIHQVDLDDWRPTRNQFDIVLALSVLPYLKMKAILKKIRHGSRIAVIECQYAGDGPGPDWLIDDVDMIDLLREMNFSVRKIGWTWVKEGHFMRTIWKCT